MEKVYTNSDYSSQILSQISELWRGNKYCDAVLNLQDEKFKLHKLVLMAACPNILRCLAHTEENNIFEFYLPEDSEKSVVMPVVNYLYIGSIQLNMTNVYGIEKLAKQLRLSTLSQFCHDFISLLESETFSQSSLQPGINQENIPKQESTEVEKIVDPKTIDALINSANATLREINTGASSLPELTDVFGQVSCLPQSTDGIGQLPFASKSIKTELDTFISPTLEETISMNEEKTITIEPLNNILQFSKSDNYMTTALATSSACKSYDSATLDIRLGSGRLEPDPFSHQTASNGTLNPQINSCQVSTSTRFTPELNIVACKPSTSQSQGGEGDDIDLVMTAEDENFDDSDDEWVPKGNESSDSDFYPESALDRSTKTKRTMSTKGPKAKKSKKNDSLTAKKKKVRGDKMTPADTKKIGDSRNMSMSSGSPELLSRVHTAEKLNRLYASDKSFTASDCPDAEERDHVTEADILNMTETQLGGYVTKDGSFKTTPESVRKSNRGRSESSAGSCTLHNKLKPTKCTPDIAKETHRHVNEVGSIDTDVSDNEDKTKQMERKLKIVEYAEIHGVKSAAELHSIKEDVVQDWILLKNHFTKKTRVDTKLSLTNKNKKIIKMGQHTDLEDMVLNWLVETQYTPGVADDVSIIQKRSLEIAEEIGKTDVNIGINWVKHMLEKYIRHTKAETANETLNIFNFELRQEVKDYAKKNGIKKAAEYFNLPEDTVACWKKVCYKKDVPHRKSTRNRYKFNFKLDAVKCAEQVGNMGAARVYGVSEKNIRDWRKQKEYLIQCEENRLGVKRSVSRPYSLVESLLENWILGEKRKITVEEIRSKALLFAEQTNSPEFKASHSWCIRFLKLHNMQEHVN